MVKESATPITPERAEALLAGGLIAEVIGGAPTSVRPLPGSSRGMPILDVTGDRGTFIVRFLPPGSPPANMQAEQRLGDLLMSLGITAPRIRFLQTPDTTLAVYRKIEGKEATDEVLGTLCTEDERQRFVDDMAALLIRLHAVPLAEACRAMGLPPISAESAALEHRFAVWFETEPIEAALSPDLAADAEVAGAWRETRTWYEAFVTRPSEMVFGHGDLHSGNVLIARGDAGWRLTGVLDLALGGIVNLYEEFLRIIALNQEGTRIIAAYNAHPECRHPVDLATARRACRAFAFYLAAGNPGDEHRTQRRSLLRWATALHASAGAS